MGRKPSKTPRLEVSLDELEAIVERSELCDDDREKLTAALETLALLTQELEMKGASIRRLRKLLFGSGSEKLDAVLREMASHEADAPSDPDGSEGGAGEGAAPPESLKRKAKGHGRNGASAYRGAAKVKIPHESLSAGKPCPSCEKGKVYGSVPPKKIVRIRGQAPLAATVYDLKRLRCNLCGEVFTARPPPGVGCAKYDATAAAMIALLKYGSGLPFYRLEGMQRDSGSRCPAPRSGRSCVTAQRRSSRSTGSWYTRRRRGRSSTTTTRR
ncbi:MAG: hypothetical protein ACE5IL_17455 [Myxococcota bacterium]